MTSKGVMRGDTALQHETVPIRICNPVNLCYNNNTIAVGTKNRRGLLQQSAAWVFADF